MALSSRESEPWTDWVHDSEVQLTPRQSVIAQHVMAKLQYPDWSKGKSTKEKVGRQLAAATRDFWFLVSPWSTPKMRLAALSNIIDEVIEADRPYADA